MLIFISIFIPASLRGSVEIWTRNEIEGNRSPVENRSKNLVWTSGRKSGISSFVRKSREKGRERICLFIFFPILKNEKSTGNKILESQILHFVTLLYLHSCLNVKYSVRWRHSWLPLRRNSVVGWHSLSAHRYNTHWNKQQRRETFHFEL